MRAGTTAVVVAYGDPAALDACLASVPGLPVVVIDNGRDDRAREVCLRRGARYERPATNLGFAAAVNVGLLLADTSHDILLLNPDARMDPGAFHELSTALGADERLAAVAPLLRRPDGSVERSEWPVPSPWQVWMDAVGVAGLVPWRRRFLTGAVLLLSRPALCEIGPFDERFFLYAEEADWQLRARRAGWRLEVVPAASAEHVGGGTSKDPALRERHFNRSAAAFGVKWHGRSGWAIMRLGSLVAAARRAAWGPVGHRAAARRALKHHLHASR